MSTYNATALGVHSNIATGGDIRPIAITRHAVGDEDVRIEIKYCGVCHSDLHTVAEDIGKKEWPVVCGHEIAGIVKEAGSKVSKFQVGDQVGVGCFVDSCMKCNMCKSGEEQLCTGGGMTQTYEAMPTHGRFGPTDKKTQGGYSTEMTINEHFAVKIPSSYPLEKAGPVLCAGITTYAPLRRFNCSKGTRVGIIGGGGLGMMGIKLAKAMGAHVTVLTTSPQKKASLEKMGADRVVVSTQKEEMEGAAQSLDLILNTISAHHELPPYISLLDKRGVIVQVGLVTKPMEFIQLPLVFQEAQIAGSLIGGMRDTQGVIDFCAEHNVYPETELVPCSKLGNVLAELLEKNTQSRRYVLDIAKTLKAP